MYHNEQYLKNVLLKSFHLNSHTQEFHPHLKIEKLIDFKLNLRVKVEMSTIDVLLSTPPKSMNQ